MRALVMKDKALRVDDVADPEPQKGQVLVRTLACGICASDTHLLAHGERLAQWSRDFGGPFDMEMARDLVMGHEFCGEILDYGPGSRRPLATGTRVTSAPTLLTSGGFAVLGYSNVYPGGFAEQMLLSEDLVRAVPDGVPTDVAALTEPVSVGFTYRRGSGVTASDVPLVVGCGAIGLAVISALRLLGAGPILASDFSPLRRELALAAGADEVFDPSSERPFTAWATMAGRKKGATPYAFECVGVPGVLDEILREAPFAARIVIAGVCLEPDPIFAAAAHTKGLNVQFGAIPMPADFDAALRAVGDGEIDPRRWISGGAVLEDSVEAFSSAVETDRHVRVMVHPVR